MNKAELMSNMTRAFSRANLKIQKHSPEILMVAGVAGVVTSAVMACRATLKVDGIVAEMKERTQKVDEVLADETISEEKYSEEDARKDKALIAVQTGLKLVKLYGPSVALGAVSIASILASNDILRKRNIALAAAYTVVDSSFKEYRERLVERFGEELDRELKYNIKVEKIEETTVDEGGKETTETKYVEVINPSNKYSQYARLFSTGDIGWTKDPVYNLNVVRQNENFANHKLRTQGYLFLNDVYEMFGWPKTPAGQIVGWVYDKNNKRGDNYIDFGLYKDDEQCDNFIKGHERSIWLDFNVDGPIWDLI